MGFETSCTTEKEKVMENTVLVKKEETVAQANQMISGLELHEATANVKQNTKLVLMAALANALNAKTAYDNAVTNRATLITALATANENVKTFISSARSVLLFFIGSLWTEAWASTGFPDQSTAVPRTVALREVLIGSLKTYFTNNPGHEVPMLNVTATIAETLRTALAEARAAYVESISDCRVKQEARDDAFTQLRKRMRGLISELETVLDPNDSRWLAFGLNVPAADATPEIPEGLVVTLLGPGTAAMHWTASARADRYRIWQKVHGLNNDYVVIETREELDFTAEDLPANSTIDFAISAVNDGGESQLSAPVTITTPA